MKPDNPQLSDLQQRMIDRYQSGELPWDAELPPPEVLDLIPTLKPGRALDLGCGTGRAAIYLARRGWTVDGVDFVPQALEIARARAAAAGVHPRFHLASVTRLDFLSGPYDFALDVGCGHALPQEALQTYREQLQRLLRPGAIYLLFAHLKEDPPPGEAVDDRWLDEETIRTVFEVGFELENVEHGQTQVGDAPPWRSAWFWYRRRG